MINQCLLADNVSDYTNNLFLTLITGHRAVFFAISNVTFTAGESVLFVL